MERVLFILFLTLGVINGVKSLYRKKNYSPENEMCMHIRRFFSALFLLSKITVPIFQIIYM